MVSLTAVTATSTENSPWRAMIFGALFTAIIALATALVFQAAIPWLYIPAFLLTGAAPVIGYQVAGPRFGRDWLPIVGGIVGFLLTFILWPILVGAFSKEQSIWRLLLASVVGFIVGVLGLLLLATIAGQNPVWFQWGWVVLWALWGGACGAAMAAYEKPADVG